MRKIKKSWQRSAMKRESCHPCRKLLDTERQMDGMSRRARIQSRIDEIFHEDWRSEEEVHSSIDDSGSSNDSPQTHP